MNRGFCCPLTRHWHRRVICRTNAIPTLGLDLLPQIDEVVIGAEDRLDQNYYQNQTAYDPSQSIDDIFAGLTAENLIEDDEDSGDTNAFEDKLEDEAEHDERATIIRTRARYNLVPPRMKIR